MTPSSAYGAGLLLVVAVMPLYLIRFSIAGIPTNLFEVAVLGLTAAGLLIPDIRRHWRHKETLLPRTILYLVGTFIAASLLSAVISDVPRVSFGIFKSWIIIPLLLGWLVYAANLQTIQPAGGTPPKAVANYKLQTIKVLILSGIIVSLISLAQFKWGERLSGIYDVSNSLALYLAPLIVLAAVRGIPSPKYFTAAGIMFLTLLLTQSVAGLFSVLIGVALGVIANTKITKTKQYKIHKAQSLPFLFSVLFGFCVLSFMFLFSTGRLAYLALPLNSGGTNSVSVRLQLWDISWNLIKEHPLLGIGLGQFEPAYQKKLHERFENHESRIKNQETSTAPFPEFVFRDPHNWVLSFWLNTGLLGFLSFLGLHAWIFWHSRHLLATNYQLLTTSSALLTLLVFGMADTIYWKNDLSALHWVLLALMLRAPRANERAGA